MHVKLRVIIGFEQISAVLQGLSTRTLRTLQTMQRRPMMQVWRSLPWSRRQPSSYAREPALVSSRHYTRYSAKPASKISKSDQGTLLISFHA